MPKPLMPASGNRSECTSIDPELVLSELSKGNFTVSSDKGTYSPEQYTTNYIGSIFDAKDSVQKFWNDCIQHVGKYINEFINVPEPESITDNAEFLDEEDELIDNPNPNSPKNEEVNEPTEEQSTPSNTPLGTVTIKASALNIRTNPNTSSEILGTFEQGKKVEIMGYTDNGWIRIKTSDNQYAYISGDKKYVSIEENVIPTPKSEVIVDTSPEDNNVVQNENITSTEEPTQVETPPVSSENTIPPQTIENPQEISSSNDSIGSAYINAESLKVRSQPNMDSEVIDYYHNGQRYKILGREGNWLKIETPDNHEAYISAKPEYVTIEENGTEGE